MKIFVAVVVLFLATGVQGSECILEMNGSWELNPKKSLDPQGLESESLVFENKRHHLRHEQPRAVASSVSPH